MVNRSFGGLKRDNNKGTSLFPLLLPPLLVGSLSSLIVRERFSSTDVVILQVVKSVRREYTLLHQTLQKTASAIFKLEKKGKKNLTLTVSFELQERLLYTYICIRC